MLHVMMGNADRRRRGIAALLGAVLTTSAVAGPLVAQGAIDPNVAPRAAALERQGERQLGTEMLGRYLAVAQSDGRAWFLLARFYRMDARDWHRSGHRTTPDADLYLSLAGVAVDEAVRLEVDSAPLYRALLELDRALLELEAGSWDDVRDASARRLGALPPLVVELGRNLVSSCPEGGVILAGSELENLAVFYGVVSTGGRGDLVPVRADLYATDSVYRHRMATALRVNEALGVPAALAAAAEHRAVCFTPSADGSLVPAEARPMRLLRVQGPGDMPQESLLSLTQLVLDLNGARTVWSRDVLAVYGAAARHNDLLCRSLAPVADDLPESACRP